MWRWSLDLIFTAKLKLESGNQKIQDGRQAAILKVTSMKIYRPLPMATNNMHIKFEIEIPKQTWVMLQKSCRLQTDGRTDRQTDRRTRWIQYNTPTPPPPTPHPTPHFESDIDENLYASAHGHKQYAYKIWNWNSKANLSYAPEIMSPTDGRTDRQIDGQGESSITPRPPPPTHPTPSTPTPTPHPPPPHSHPLLPPPPPPPPPSTSLGGGMNTKHCRLKWRGSQSTYVADNIFFKVNEKYEIG